MEWKKKKGLKIFNYQWDVFRIQSDKTPIGLHGEGRKSNLSDKKSLKIKKNKPDKYPYISIYYT